MIKVLFAGIFLLFIIQSAAQKNSVLLEPQTRTINQGNPLPSQTSFTIQVPVSAETGIIRINIFKGSKLTDVIQRTYWVRPVNFTGNIAELPIDVKLRTNNRYGFDVTIYSLLSDSEAIALKEITHQNLIKYLNAIIQATDKGIEVERKTDNVMADLNSIVRKSLTYYANIQQRNFEGFSDIVKLKLQQIEKARLSNARYNLTKEAADSSQTPDGIKTAYAKELITQLQQIILNETDNYLNLDFVKLYDAFVVPNRSTERSQTVLPLFVGYGGVYLSGSFDNLAYDSQPYAGLSFPLGRGNETHFGRTSFILGVFINNFRDKAGNTITGPIVNRPVFTGLGFRIYDFINFNAGVVATSTQKINISNVKTENIQLKPFIGVNAQFNLWLGMNKK